MANQRWKPIPGCSNYVIGSRGDVKRLKHKANGKRYKILSESLLKFNINRSGVVYVNVIADNGKQRVFSVQKLVMEAFLEKGYTYYKVSPDWSYEKNVQVFNNRVDQFIRVDVYDRMTYKPIIFKTIRV